jgi:hypothetical protein
MSTENSIDLEHRRLCELVQENCHIADARYARDYSLCIYLLKMREYYRWEKKLSLTASIPKEDLGNWVMEREGLWDELEERDFAPVELGTRSFDPFDERSINELLTPSSLVYSAGIGRFGQPHFFIAELDRIERLDGLTVYVSSREIARDLVSPPAMALGKRIFVRRESLRRVLWELADEARWSKGRGAMARVLEHYHFDDDAEGAIERMTDHELGTVILHEMGEAMAGEELDPHWHEMLACIADVRAELWVRAVRDNFADCLVTLPVLLEREDIASLQFYVANLRAMRKELFPGFLSAYEHWRSAQSLAELRRLVPEACRHWKRVAGDLLDIFARGPEDLDTAIDEFVMRQGVY